MNGSDLLASFGKLLGDRILAKTEFRGETTFLITKEDLREIAKSARDELSFDYLLDITSIDN
nr:NADH-quinone oxidoreductase subunit C [Verrucomicrobiota bacterium]